MANSGKKGGSPVLFFIIAIIALIIGYNYPELFIKRQTDEKRQIIGAG